MGWGDCGEDSNGRPIGYVFPAICDEPDCKKEIDRGLSYACGNWHGETEWGCEKYFCSKHLLNTVQNREEDLLNVCNECYKNLMEQVKTEDCLIYDDHEGMIIEK